MSENEKVLLEKAKNGDIEAFELLIAGYQKKAFNIAFRMMGNYDDASELTQEALIRVFKSINKFKEESSFSTWIYRITMNICLDELRKRKNKNEISIDEEIHLSDGEVKLQIEDERPTPDIIAEKKELKRIVNEAINKLPEEHKAVIVMRDIQGFTYEQIADVLKCPEGTVKSRINRARLGLKEILKNKKELLNQDYVK